MKRKRPAKKILRAETPVRARGATPVSTDRLATVVAGAIVLAVVAGLGILVISGGSRAYRYVLSDERLVVSEIVVEGVKALSDAEIISRAGISMNAPINDIDLVAVADRIEDHPRISDAVVERHLPRTVIIKVHERTPIALLQREGAIWGIDRTGRVIPMIPAREEIKGPIITGEIKEGDDLTLEALAMIDLLRPDLVARVSEVRLDPSAGVTLITTEYPTVVRLGRGEMPKKIERLRAALAMFSEKNETKEYIDLRFEDLITRP